MIRRCLVLFFVGLVSVVMVSAQLVRVGIDRMEVLLPLLKGQRVGLVVNQTSVMSGNQVHLVDTLLHSGVNIVSIFSPEHGFRGDYDAGDLVKPDKMDSIPIYSLYGKTFKPTRSMLSNVDVLVYDIQDVGVRFFTYISTLHYVLEAAVENGVSVIVCDRPNPNDYVDGPLLEDDCRSFIGLDPIPIVYGLTIGELATMINGQGWLRNKMKSRLTVIRCQGWNHGDEYVLPVKPSPNLPSHLSVKSYPSLCFFEPTIMSVGRGTIEPFTRIAYPNNSFGEYQYTPKSIPGASVNPKYKGKECYGKDYTGLCAGKFTLEPLLEMNKKAKALGYNLIKDRRTFELLCGNKRIYKYIKKGMDEAEIRATWQEDLKKYEELRRNYLLY